MASPTQWTWVWVNSRSWWWTGRPGMLQFMGSLRVGHDWVTELNWIHLQIDDFYDRGWDGWMASPTQWTWVWVKSRGWWGTGRPGMLRFMGSQRVRHDWATELNWTELYYNYFHFSHSDGCVMILLGNFNLHFSEDWRCRVLFIFLLTIRITSFVKSPFRSIAYNISCLCYWNMLNKF